MQKCAGLLFAVQPGPVEAVIWVAAASELMATAFFVLTVWLFWRALATARRAPYVLSCLSFFACILTHESGVMLLPVLFLTLWLLPPDPTSTRATSVKSHATMKVSDECAKNFTAHRR